MNRQKFLPCRDFILQAAGGEGGIHTETACELLKMLSKPSRSLHPDHCLRSVQAIRQSELVLLLIMELSYQGGNLDQAAYVPWCQSASFCMSVYFSSDRVYSFTKCFRSVCNTLKLSNPDPSGSNLHVAGDNQVRSESHLSGIL